MQTTSNALPIEKPGNNIIVLFIILIAAIAGPEFCADIFVPSLPAITQHFNTVKHIAAYTITGFLLGQAITQLLYGPLSDRFGRKPTLLLGCAVCIIGSVICVVATHIDTLILGRVLQGAGSAAGVSMTLAIIRDVSKAEKLAKTMAIIITIYFVAFAVAPIIGGYLQAWFDWRASFIFLLIYFVALIIAIMTLYQETHLNLDSRSTQPKVIIKNYSSILKSRVFMGYLLCASFAYSAMFVYASVSPFLFQKVLHLSSVAYGWLSIFIAIALIIASSFTGFVVEKIGIHKLNVLAMFLLIGSSLVMLALGLAGLLNIWVVMLPLSVFIFAGGILGICCTAGAMTPFGHIAGSAGAMWGSAQFFVTFAVSLIAAHIYANTQIPFAISLLGLGVLSTLSLWLAAGKK